MGPEIAIALTVFKGLQALWEEAKRRGLVSDAETTSLVNSSIHIAGEAINVITDATQNPGKYDTMTPEEILKAVLPSGEDELNARIQARLAEG